MSGEGWRLPLPSWARAFLGDDLAGFVADLDWLLGLADGEEVGLVVRRVGDVFRVRVHRRYVSGGDPWVPDGASYGHGSDRLIAIRQAVRNRRAAGLMVGVDPRD